MVPAVFGTARLVVAVLWGLAPSRRPLLPSANHRERQRGSLCGLRGSLRLNTERGIDRAAPLVMLPTPPRAPPVCRAWGYRGE